MDERDAVDDGRARFLLPDLAVAILVTMYSTNFHWSISILTLKVRVTCVLVYGDPFEYVHLSLCAALGQEGSGGDGYLGCSQDPLDV